VPSDVRIRLSAEGVADVVGALKKLQTEAAITAQKSKAGFAGLNSVLGLSQGLLANLGVAVGVGAFVALANSAAESAHQLENAAEAIGTTTERLVGLQTAAQLGGVDADRLTESLGRLTKKVDDFRSGSAAASAPFNRLRLSVKDFDGLDTAQQFDLVAKAIAKVPDAGQRAALTIDILGRRGARLVPVMNQLARGGGLEGTIEQARKLGLILSEQIIANAARAAAEIKLTSSSVRSLATEFISGLAPAADQTFRILTAGFKDGQQGANAFGEAMGGILRILNLVLSLALELVDVIGTLVTEIGSGLGTAIGAVLLVVTGHADRLPILWRNMLDALKRETDDFVQRSRDRITALQRPLTQATVPPPAGAGPPVPPDPQALFSKRLAAVRSALDAELKMLQLQLRLQAAAEERRFKEGLDTVGQYYAARRRIIEDGIAAEIRTLESRRKVESANPDRDARLTALRETDAEIARLRAQSKGDVAALNAEEIQAERAVAEERIGFEKQVLDVQGRTHEQRLLDIQEEVNKYALLLAKEKESEASTFRKLNAFQQILIAGAAFQDDVRAFQAAVDSLQGAKQGIADDVAAARISEEEGLRRTLALEHARLPDLERLAELAKESAAATGDPEKIAQANSFAEAIRNIGHAADEATRLMVNMHKEVGDILLPALTDFFSITNQGFGNLKDKALAAIGAIVIALQQLFARLLALQILKAIGFSFPAGATGGLVSGGQIQARARGGLVRRLEELPLARARGGVVRWVDAQPAARRASGGLLRGPGSGTSDSILARLSDHEYVVRAAVVRQPGALQFLEAFNAGAIDPRDVAQAGARAPRFAEGGLAQAPAASDVKLGGKVTIGLEDGLVARAIGTRAGTAALLEVLSKNRSAVSHALGRQG
jgi:hypothetical protein